MSSSDPTGYESQVAEIQPNALSERQQRVGIGLAMIRDGASYSEAARVCGIERRALARYEQKLRQVDSKEGDGMTVALDALQKGAMTAALIATERVTERLVDPEHEWKDGDLIKAQGVNIDKVLAFQAKPIAPADSGVSALERLLDQADVTLTKKDPANEAIEVEATTPTDTDTE